MSLSDFIEANLRELVEDWTEYARTISLEESHLDERELRNSARDILIRIAADMREPQSDVQQKAKSRGEEPASKSSFNETAHLHADDRLAHGYGINEVVAEYRALRASVLRRWLMMPQADAAAFQEMIRFNEAIDQMLAESVRQYAQRSQYIRDLFAGVLAHDLRSPVGAILNSADVLLRDNALSAFSARAVANVQRSAVRLKRMIDDLFIFARARLGEALPVEFTPQDLGRIASDAAEEVRAAWPDARIEVCLTGDLAGRWDGARVGQLLVNLLVNAVQHGSGKICLSVAGQGEQMTLAVSNEGDAIPARARPTLFDPLTRANPSPGRSAMVSGMGLGLYICRCIARAHHGTIWVDSTKDETTFTVQMPRFPSSRS
ncbi:sensor histidine kinase [Paraburkholderia mimosarum]|uniref:sensor histidine kinase n=1 Tax=Paraburkholderia mimosarum TaxID=312026 RepID=UPI0003F6CDCD|nr:HAMP domain-containing sensor histidine kinase [Paraburkholderia mimosarum]